MMSDEAKEGKAGKNDYKRTIDWKHGFAIGMGIPILVLPSIGYLASYCVGSCHPHMGSLSMPGVRTGHGLW